jgi:NhaP-type Na+/H+ or K+/H+ antiporter
MVETVIFAYLGLFLFSSRYHWNIYHTMIAIASCCLSRAIMIPFLSALANWVTKFQQVRNDCRYKHLPQQEKDPSAGNSSNAAGVIIDKKMQLVLWFAGLRGAMSFALIEDIPTYDTVTGEGTRLKSELKAMTSACIIFTVFVLGGLTYYMMDSLGMAPSHKKERPSNMEKELEMIGLLGGNGSFSNRSEDDDPDPANEMLTSQVMPQGPASSTSFRQRSPQLTL